MNTHTDRGLAAIAYYAITILLCPLIALGILARLIFGAVRWGWAIGEAFVDWVTSV